MFLKILGAVLALALGLWLGLPGRYQSDPEEIERTMTSGVGRSRKVKRYFTPLAWVQRQIRTIRTRGHQRRRGFRLERPDE